MAGPMKKLGSFVGSAGKAGNNLLSSVRQLLPNKSKDKQL